MEKGNREKEIKGVIQKRRKDRKKIGKREREKERK